jgi:hypothetical protein
MDKGYNDLYMLIQGLRLKELLCKEKKKGQNQHSLDLEWLQM